MKKSVKMTQICLDLPPKSEIPHHFFLLRRSLSATTTTQPPTNKSWWNDCFTLFQLTNQMRDIDIIF